MMFSHINIAVENDLEPTEFYLSQNYPNPFKEKTTIKYCVAYKTRVQLTVSDHYGNLVEELVNDEMQPGTYSVEFKTSTDKTGKSRKLDQGYYSYRMKAGDFASEIKWFCINNLSGRINMKTLLQTLFFLLLTAHICFAQWVQVGLGDKTVKDIAARNSNIFAITADSGSVYRSTNNGLSWFEIVDTGAINIEMASSGMIFLVKESEPIWGYPTSSLFSSSNNGDIWDTVNVIEQLPPNPGGWPAWPTNVSVSPTGLVFCGIYVTHDIGGSWTRFALSTDDGSTWILSSWDLEGGILFDFRGQKIITFGGTYVSGGFGEDINLSYDNGQTWFERQAPYPCPTIRTLNLCLNGNVIAGTLNLYIGCGGLYLSADSCTNWTQISSVIPQASLSIETGGTLVGTENLGVFLFSDNGDSLGSRNDGLTNLNVQSLTIDNNNYVYAGTDNGVWKRTLSEIVTSIKETSAALPSLFLLSQNYPNPFNPSTKIKYSIPRTSQVQIKVFDVLGNEIETLVNEEKPEGAYELTWNAEELPSGVYFYQLKAGEFIQTKKMILLR